MLSFTKSFEPRTTQLKHLLSCKPSATAIKIPLPKYRNQSSQTNNIIPQQESEMGSFNQATKFLISSQISQKSNVDTLFLLLRSVTNLNSLDKARQVHGLLLVTGLHPNNVVLGSQLVNIYITCENLQEALVIFYQLPKKSVFAGNSILKGLVNQGQFDETLKFYNLMLNVGLTPDNFTFPLVLKACSGLSALEEGKQIRDIIYDLRIQNRVRPNIFVECALIDMFSKCGRLVEARQVFDEMPGRDLVSWSAMIGGAVQNGEWREALNLFEMMISEGMKPDSVMVVTVLPACGRLGALQLGKNLHGFVVKNGFKNDLSVMNALIDMYSKCGQTEEARRSFQAMEYRDVVSWSSMIAGYSYNLQYTESLKIYEEMSRSGIRPNSITVASVLPGFAHLKMCRQGKEIHNYIIRNGFQFDAFVGSALIDMYAKSGLMKSAEFVFNTMLDKDIAIWNSMITGYSLNEDLDSAFALFRRIQESYFKPNTTTIVSILPICTRLATVRQGKEIHSYATRKCLGFVVSVGNSLIDMYCKCGYLELGVKVFRYMIEKDAVSYNTIIGGLGIHGNGDRAFLYYSQMQKARIKPDKVTFIALISACSHSGLIDRGWFFYNSMINDYGIIPAMEHYSCMVDLLGRSGFLNEAWEFIKKMPVQPEIDVLGSLLGACRVHNKVELAELVGKSIFDMKPDDPGYYVLLSNIYAASGRRADASKVRGLIKDRGLTKKPGCSWIEVGRSVNYFVAREGAHQKFDKISEILGSLLLQIKEEGYVPELSLE